MRVSHGFLLQQRTIPVGLFLCQKSVLVIDQVGAVGMVVIILFILRLVLVLITGEDGVID